MSDLDSIHELHSFPETDEFNALGIPKNIDVTKSIIEPWIEKNKASTIKNYTFTIEGITEKNFIGLFGFNLGKEKYKRGEVWYKLHPTFWKKGFATESLQAVINFGFTKLNLHRIEAGCAVDNAGSIRVLEKVGMKREGTRRQILPLSTGWADNYEYAILENDKRQYK